MLSIRRPRLDSYLATVPSKLGPRNGCLRRAEGEEKREKSGNRIASLDVRNFGNQPQSDLFGPTESVLSMAGILGDAAKQRVGKIS